MEQTALCALARAYVTYSNAHDLEAIGALFADHARYESAHAGIISGRDAILSMMRTFFTTYPDVHWDADGFAETSPRQVAFDFRMRATDEHGDCVMREGRELIVFSTARLIENIRVGGRDAAPQG